MLNQEEETKFVELKNKCRELKVPAPMDIFIGLEVKDHNGIVTFDDIQRGHSWTRNWYNAQIFGEFLFSNTQSSFGAGYASIRISSGAISGAANYLGPPSIPLGLINSTAYGIVVGTGDTAFSTENYVLASLIATGTGSGQFSYQAETTTSAAYDNTAGAEKWTCTRARVFNNNSGASITVKETGCIGYNSGYYTLFERSVLSPTVDVANGAQLTVTYNFTMDFSAID